MNINVSGNYTLELTPEAFQLQTANIYLQCNTGAGAVNITLPRITTIAGVTTTWGFKIFLNDISNNASVNNITIIPHPADKINGVLSTPIVLSTNGVTGHLQVTGGNSWEFNVGSTSTGGAGLTLEMGSFVIDNNTPSGNFVVNTVKRPKMIFIFADFQQPFIYHVTSDGRASVLPDNSILQSFTAMNNNGSGTFADTNGNGYNSTYGAIIEVKAINAPFSGQSYGWSAILASVSNNSFTLLLGEFVNKPSTVIQWQAFTE